MAVNFENRLQRENLRKINRELIKSRDKLDELVRVKTTYLRRSEEKFSKAFQNALLMMAIVADDGGF